MDNPKLVSNYGRGNAHRNFLSTTVRNDVARVILLHWNRNMDDCSRIPVIVRHRQAYIRVLHRMSRVDALLKSYARSSVFDRDGSTVGPD